MGNPNTYVGILKAEFVRVRFTYNHALRIFRGIYVISRKWFFDGFVEWDPSLRRVEMSFDEI